MWMALSLLPIVFLAVAAWRDVATRTIPDSVSAALLLIGLALRARAGVGAVGASVAVAAALFALFVVLHARGMIGGGDAKLVAAVAVGLAPHVVPAFVMVTAFAGFLLAVTHLLVRRWPLPTRLRSRTGVLRRIFRVEHWRIVRRGPLPYGVAIACGGAWVILAAPGV